MKKLIYSTMALLLSLSVLTACNFGDNNPNDPTDVNYDPVHYNDNDMNNNDMNRGLDLDMDRDHIRQPGEPDTINNMDEEEPDLDEEPSEEKRGY